MEYLVVRENIEVARANADESRGQEPMLGRSHPSPYRDFLKHYWGKLTKNVCLPGYPVPQNPPSHQVHKTTSRFSFTTLHPTYF